LFAPFVVSGFCWFERNNSFVIDMLRTHYACESLCALGDYTPIIYKGAIVPQSASEKRLPDFVASLAILANFGYDHGELRTLALLACFPYRPTIGFANPLYQVKPVACAFQI